MTNPPVLNAVASLSDPATGPWDRLRTIIESLPDGVLIVNDDGEIRFANSSAARLLDRPAPDLIGTQFGSSLESDQPSEMEIVRHEDGIVTHLEIRVVPTDWEGEMMHLVSLREITDRKHADERARQLACEREARVEAQAASQAKSDFLAIMSHELRTPLNAILGYSELMELGISGDLTDTMRKQVGRIRVSATHLLALVNDILDLAKVEAGRLSVATNPSHALDVLAASIEAIKEKAQEKNIDVSVVAGSEELPLYIGDDERVRQILVNLLSNAVKCTANDGKITVEAIVSPPAADMRLLTRASYVCIRVTDTGSGVPPEKLETIFEPFVQADSGPTRSQEGSGLGLTIGRRLARAMGGDLTLASELDKGSTFSLWLPADVRVGRDGNSSDSSENNAAADTDLSEGRSAMPTTEWQVRGLAEVANRVLSQLGPIVDKVVNRIRVDSVIETPPSLRTSQVADHLSTLVADIISSLAVLEDASGKPSQMLADAIEIQRLVADRHGAQRARLGWNEASMRREFMIIREGLTDAITKAVTPGGELKVGVAAAALGRFVDQAELASVRALDRENSK